LASSSLGFNLISDRTIRLFEGDSAQKSIHSRQTSNVHPCS
jgi:hypothetical protein